MTLRLQTYAQEYPLPGGASDLEVLQYVTHGHRKLRLVEDFEMLCLTPDFETLRLTCDFETLCQTPSQTQQFEIRKLHLVEDFEILRLTYDFETWRLMPARRNVLKHCLWRASNAMFRNHTSDVTFRNQESGTRFQNQALFYVSMRQTCSRTGVWLCMGDRDPL